MNHTDIAQIIWKRFANSSVETWDDETHKAEYLDCAREIAESVPVRRGGAMWSCTLPRAAPAVASVARLGVFPIQTFAWPGDPPIAPAKIGNVPLCRG